MSETGAADGVGRSGSGSSRAVRWSGAAAAALLAVLALVEPGLAQQTEQVYGDFPVVGPRGAVWIAAQLHLMFAAFVLGVPMFAVVVEGIGMWTGEKRYDRLSKEFTRLLLVAYSATAIWGAVLVFFLSTLYPTFWRHLTEVFAPTMWAYAGLFFFESFTLYVYYYGWNHMKEGAKKKLHLGLGVLLNVWGTLVLFIADSWLSYMMSPPSGVTAQTDPASIELWNAVMNFTWMPINIHRLIANVVFGGAIVGAYAAYRFLAADSDEERAHYDWMGYVGNFIAIAALLVLPFAGYWLGREIYAYDQAMGITMMGGFMSWLWIIQAFLIGVLFLAGNYYLWTGMDRIPGAERFQKYTKYLLAVLVLGFVVWATPHTMIASRQELAAMGGSHHPFLNVLGVMSAKNTAVNFMILATFISFMLYRRANKVPKVDWAKAGTWVQAAAVAVAAGVVLFYGVYGYFVTAEVRIGFSVYQVLSVLAAMVFVVGLDVAMMRGAESRGSIRWGKMPERSQYALFILAVTFTWLMGLMGFARSGIRQHWHVYQTVRDTSSQAATPALGHAAIMISVCVLIFFALVGLIFWLGTLAEEGSGGGGAKAVGEEGAGGGPGADVGEEGPRLESAEEQVA
ncbi:MAG: cytochrome ubiquinol oxidase subunit I [Candidatus Palauibacterales bacterium]|nr:cytochrome ubiquinol oxidase subunit I [Candidatus Palauibacterales bacterium]